MGSTPSGVALMAGMTYLSTMGAKNNNPQRP